MIITSSTDGYCKVLELSGLRLLRNLCFRVSESEKNNYCIRGIRYDRRNRHLFTIQSPMRGSTYLTKWDLNTFSPINTVKASDKIVISMDYSESRGKLALGGSESDLIFFDAGSLSKAKSFNLGQNSVKTVCFGENILMAGTTDNALIMNNIYGSSPISISTILKLLILALFIYYLKTKA